MSPDDAGRPPGPYPPPGPAQGPGPAQAPAQGPYQGPPQAPPRGPYQGPPQAPPQGPYQGPPQAPAQGRPHAPGPAPPPGPAAGPPPRRRTAELAEPAIRSGRFRRGREAGWIRLEALVAKLEKKGVGSLTASEATELPKLYQAQISSLAVARNSVLDRNLLEYLENLSLRAYLAVYGPRTRLGTCLAEFLRSGFPSSVRALWPHLLVAALVMLSGTLVGLLMVLAEHEYYTMLIPEALAGDRTFASTREELLDEEIFAPFRGFENSFIHFASMLFRHNTQVSLMCFGLGFCLGIPTLILLFSNGLSLGAMIALHVDKGVGVEFLGWLSIHGVTELTAVCLAAAGGLAVAEKIVFPGRRSRIRNLAEQGLPAARIMIGAMFMLLAAGVLEGGFRQLLASTSLRFLVALMTTLFWGWYFLRAGRAAGAQGDGGPLGGGIGPAGGSDGRP